ncbi:GNAT family N-acetyltransferase [Eubacteriales bacterium OttesenSCG-928-K08]|nr:GNAT family N-acetyltransferase [Eubacteriales bacterium OttesenSCG-928-K08]
MVTITEAITKKDLKRFIKFANELYEGNPYYVPDMLDSQVNDFVRDKNPAYEYCDTKCFLAWRQEKIVGRIAAIHNRTANEKYQRNQMRFWHMDFIDDVEVVDALFGAVEAWAKELGCESVHGPLGFSDMDREGMLIEGFDQLSMFITYYNHPYYKEHMERMGYRKETDWLEFKIEVGKDDKQGRERLDRLATAVERRSKLQIVPLKNKKEIRPHVEDVFELYNEVYNLFGMIPLTPSQVERYVNEFLPLIDERTTTILKDQDGKVVAFGVVAPTISHAMQKCKGNMLPFGWYHMLKALKGKNDTLDMFLIAVHPDWQGKGVTTIMINRIVKFAMENGIRFAETGPELESNTNVHAQWRFFNYKQHKRRRCYIKEI